MRGKAQHVIRTAQSPQTHRKTQGLLDQSSPNFYQT